MTSITLNGCGGNSKVCAALGLPEVMGVLLLLLLLVELNPAAWLCCCCTFSCASFSPCLGS
jgi:hypothetical protein